MADLLSVKNLTVEFSTSRGALQAVQNVSFAVRKGESLGIVGESGSGKSVTGLAILNLLANNAKILSGEIMFNGQNILQFSEKEMLKIRGARISMIFQDPMTSLNPCFTVGEQIMETIKIHEGGSATELYKKSVSLLAQVGITDPDVRMKAFPHELSGGMAQRVMIAISIACKPDLLIADEPTTALDVTIQAQVLALIRKIQNETGMGLILVSHDMGVIVENTSRCLVMYAGQVVESGETHKVIKQSKHPYTEGLLKCLPGYAQNREFLQPLPSIPGVVPDLMNRPQGCQLHPRCAYKQQQCLEREPILAEKTDHSVKCFYPLR